MSELLRQAYRDALQGDIIGALDYAESVHRGLQRMSAQDRLGYDHDTFQRLQICAKTTYEDSCRLRQLADEASL